MFSLSISRTCRQHSDTKRDYKLVAGLQQKMGNYHETVIGKISLILKIPSITTMCCVVLEKTSKRKKPSQIINECNNSKNNNTLTLVIRKITKHNKMDYHQRNLILEKCAYYKGRLLMIYRNCIIM